MQVRVLLFGALKESMPLPSAVIEMPERSTVEQLLQRVMDNAPRAHSFLGSLAVAVNREYTQVGHVLQDGDEVALLPPVSGGCSEPDALVRLQRESIQADTLLAQLKHGEDGAVVVFDGIVRDNTRGHRTLYLDYEAYETMALQKMTAMASEAKNRFGVRDVALIHRLGRLQIGESSVWIAVASAHRAQAFEACRWIIDTLKKTVPIWKKEYFEDGAVWADGERFPAELALGSAAEK